MDPSVPWTAYGQHYPPRLSGPGNPGGGLAHASQINDLSLPPSLPRQDNAAFGGTPSLLLPAHHGLNVSTGGPAAESPFVNSSNLLSATYDSMLSSYPPAAKNHLGALNMAHNQPLFKALGKESELNELRGGFSRRPGIPQAALPSDPGVGIASSSALSPAGMYNAQSSPHSWRPSDIVSTPSSPFGVLPHEAVMQRGNAEPTGANQVQKSSHEMSQGNRFSDSDTGMDYRNIMSVSSHPQSSPVLEPVNNPPRTPMLMTRSETISPAAETMNMNNIKPGDYGSFHGDGSNLGNSRGSIINQNFITHGQFPPMEVHNENPNVFTTDGLSSTCKNSFGSGAKTNVASPDMFGNGLTSPVSTNSPSPAHHVLHSHHHSPISNPQMSPRNTVHPSSTGSQTQSRDMSSYSAYSTTPTIPTNSQSFLANQLPSPALGVNSGYGNQAGHFIPLSSACSSVSSSSGEMTSVAYSPVITRAGMSSHNAYTESVGKNVDQKSVELPNDRLKLHDIPYDNVKLGHMDNSMGLGDVGSQVPAMMTEHSTNLANNSSKLMNVGSMIQQGSLGVNVSSQQCAMSPRNFPVNDLYGEQGRNRQKVQRNKMDPESPASLPLGKYDPPSHKRAETGPKRRGRRRKRKAERAESPIDRTVQITRMTPLNAHKLSHKMAPSPMSFPLQRPPTSSPLGPMDLSNSELLDQSSKGLSHNYISSLDNKRGCDLQGANSSNASPPEISPPQLPATPMSMAGSTSTVSCGSVSPKHKKAYPTIEDDLGFLAELPSACNVGSRKSASSKSSSNNCSTSSSSSTNGSFLESFLKFVRGDSPSMLNTGIPKRGRQRARYAAFSCPSTSGANDLQWDLNPTTGLFTENASDKPSDLSSLDYSARAAAKLHVDNPNHEAPQFSSDEDFSANEVVQTSLDRLSDACSSEKGIGNVEKSDGRPELKIKLVGLQSGNLKMAQKTKTRRRKRRKSDTKVVRQRSRRLSEVEDEYDISNITDLSEENSNHSSFGKSSSVFPQRETSMRKCKEKVMKTRQEEIEKRKQQTLMETFIPREINEFLISDSDKEASESNDDSDPAWTPIRRDGTARQHRNSSVDDDKANKPSPGRSRRQRKTSRLSFHRMKQRRIKKPQIVTNDSWKCGTEIKDSTGSDNNTGLNNDSTCQDDSKNSADIPLFEIGDFIVPEANMEAERPSVMWRVDGKSLLQKFEPFQDENGKMYYKGKSSYSGLVSSKQKNYQLAQVRILNCDRNSFIVEYVGLQSEAKDATDLKPDSDVKVQGDDLDLNKQKESFEVYIQTLISQALDHNFISEIVKEEDEYFLSHLHEIDKVVDKCKTCILERTEWSDSLKCCIEQLPELNWSSEDDDFLGVDSSCQACFLLKPCLQKLSFSGQPYSTVTLLVQKSPDASLLPKEKEFRVCSACSETITLYNQIYHQKFRLFTLCSWKVRDIQQSDRDKESHVILEFCLEDADWINKLFEQTVTLWHKCLWYNR